MVDCYLAQDDAFQARATLQSIIKNTSDKATQQQAQAKLKAMAETTKGPLKLVEKETVVAEDKDFRTIDPDNAS